MKKFLALLLAGWAAVSFTACSNGGEEGAQTDTSFALSQTSTTKAPSLVQEETPSSSNAQTAGETTAESSAANRLVAYFSYAENAGLPDGVDASATASIQVWDGRTTGNTGVVAAMIAQAAQADLFSIQTEEKYPDSYDATIDQGQEERNANARPKLATHVENLEQYDVIFLGFPNWWGDMPMALYSFLEETDLSGKTIVPFVTSGGSGFSGTIQTIESMEPGATVEEGLSISASGATGAQEQVNEWLRELGYTG